MRNNRIPMLIVLLLTALATWAQDNNRLQMGEVAAQVGTTFDLPVSLQNTNPNIVAAQFELTLPQGVTLKTVENSSSETRYITKEPNRLVDHTVRVKQLSSGSSGYTYRVMLLSPQNKTIHANRGQLFAIRASIDGAATLTEGQSYPISLQNVVLSDSLGRNVLTGFDQGSLLISSSADFVVRNISITAGSTRQTGGRDRFEPLQDFTLTWTVKNIGAQANETAEGWSEQISLIGVQSDGSGNPVLLGNDHLLQMTGERCAVATHRNTTETLGPGESRQYSATFTVPRIPGLDGLFGVQIKLVPNANSGERESCQGNNTTSSLQQEDLEGNLLTNRTDAIYFMGKQLYLKLPATIYENSSGTQTGYGTLERSGSRLTEENVTLSLQTAVGEQRITLDSPQATFSRNSGQTSVLVRVANDDILNGDVVEYTVSASSDAYETVQQTASVVDDERPTITMTLTDPEGNEMTELNEGDEFVLHISTNRASAEATVIQLAARYDDTNYIVSRFQMKSEVVLPPGETSIDVPCSVLNDNEPALPAWMTITASYADYHAGTVSKFLNDDDMPHLHLTLSSYSVTEGDGPNALVATLTRLKQDAGSLLTIDVKCEIIQQGSFQVRKPATRLYSNVQRFQMAPGVLEAQFTLGCVDNQNIDPQEDILITATVYLKNCGCQVDGHYSGYGAAVVRLSDDDGKALTLQSHNANILENSTGNTFTVTRNYYMETPLEVTISATHVPARDEEGNDIEPAPLTFPTTVTIPAGQPSADFTVDVGLNSTDKDTHTVTFFAEAEEHGTGSTWVLCTDQTMPDATIGELEMDHDVYVRRFGYIQLNVYNNGFNTLPKGTAVDFYIDRKLMKTLYTKNDLEPGEHEKVLYPGPYSDTPGEKEVYVVVNQNRSISEVNYNNNTSERVTVYVKPLLTVTELTTDAGWYGTEDAVTISGRCEGLEVAEADVELYAIQGGSRTVIPAKTDEYGRFTARWDHPGPLAGQFLLGGCMPGEELTTTLHEISLYGMRRTSNSFLTHEMEEKERKEYYIDLRNPGNLTLSNIRMVPVGQVPANIRFDATTLNGLAANGGEGRIVYHIEGYEASANRKEWETMKVRIVSDEGAVIDQTLYYVVYPATSLLTANVKNINTTMTIGQTTNFELVLTNEGREETGEVYIDLGNAAWLNTATPQRMASLQPGESTTAVLQLHPTVGMEAHSITTGNLYISAANGGSLSLPFRVETVSEASGGLTVDVWDEFTTNGGAEAVGPHVSGATVAVLHPVTQQLLRQFVTGDDGTVTFDDLNAGKYILRVTHPKHDSYQDEVYVSAGRTVTQRVFICYSAVTITMTYEPTEIEDEYEIVTSVTFETNVPRPFVAINQPDHIYLEELDQFPYMYYVTLTNTGMVKALNTRFETPEWNGLYHFTPLLEGPWNILPQQSIIIPVEITKEEAAGARAHGPRRSSDNPFVQCALSAICKYQAPCTYQNLSNPSSMKTAPSCGTIADVIDMLPGFGTGGGPSGPGGSGPGGGGGTTTQTNNGSGGGVSCSPCMDDPGGDIDRLKGMKSGKAKDMIENGLPLFRPCGGGSPRMPQLMSRSMTPRKAESESSFISIVSEGWRDMQTAMILSRELVRTLNEQNCLDNPAPINIPNVGLDDWRALDENYQPFFIPDEGKPSWLKAFHNDLAYAYDVNYHKLAYCYHILNDWEAPLVEPAVLRPIVTRLHDREQLTNQELMALKPEGLTDGQWTAALTRLQSGLAPGGADAATYVDYDLLEDIYSRIQNNTMEINRKGYATAEDLVLDAVDKAEEKLLKNKDAVCATVKLELKQRLTMTRQAVRGTLTVVNGSATESMRDITLNFVVTDPEGNVATRHIMEITTESLDGLSGQLDYNSGWTLGAKETGVATFLFIPTRYAAPEEPVQYTFAGTITFRDPFTGEMMTRELETERLTVTPSPVLDLTYFMQRDILGDDPLTPTVEPIVPAQFSLLINNKGYGDATKVKMLTNQPEVVENEKGLLVDLQIVSSQLNGGDKTLALGQSVATDFGTIPAQSTVYAQWWMTSTLTGHFTSYDVAATHLTSYDNPDLTLLDQVTIHELIHQIEVPGGQSQTPPLIGFMCNDVEDYDDLPDQMYLSDGTTAPVTVVASASTQPRDESTDQFLLTVYPGQEGWNYGSVADPTGGNRRLLRVQRWNGSAGEELPLANFWQTDRTLVDALDPVYENRLHFCDQMAYGGNNEAQVIRYVLTFETKPEKVLAVQSISGLPQNNTFSQTPITSVTVNFNKPINASTFTTADLTLMHEGEWKATDDITITQVNETTYTLDLSSYTTLDGYYTLTVQTKEINDLEGFNGEEGKTAGWIQTTDGKANLKVKVVPEGGGTATPATGKQDFFGTVSMTATPAPGYTFNRWLQDGNEVSLDRSFTYQMFGPATLVAEFTPQTESVAIHFNHDAGSIEGYSSGFFNHDSQLSLVPKPKTGYYFAGWELLISESEDTELTYDGDTLNVLLKGSLEMRANFEKLAIAEVIISETADDNVSVFTSQPNGVKGTQFNVRLQRNLKKGRWNTLCLPFDLTEQQINKTWGYGTNLVKLRGMSGNTMNMEYAWNIKAGEPYMIMPEIDLAEARLEFKGTLNFATEPKPAMLVNGDNQQFGYVGIYSPHTWNWESGEEYYFRESQATLYQALESTLALNGLRAYFVIPQGVQNARLSIAGIEDDVDRVVLPTEIITPGVTRIYNLQGQYVGSSTYGLKPGVYIINGKKGVVK